jgi:hypothetical protein
VVRSIAFDESSHSCCTEAMLYAFDLLELDGQDLRQLPLLDRKLGEAGGRASLGIVLSDHTDQDGTTIFQPAAWALRALCRNG